MKNRFISECANKNLSIKRIISILFARSWGARSVKLVPQNCFIDNFLLEVCKQKFEMCK